MPGVRTISGFSFWVVVGICGLVGFGGFSVWGSEAKR